MVISIKIASKAGIDVNAGAGNDLDAMPSMFDPGANNFGYFYKSITNASAYGLAEAQEGALFSGGAALLARGQLAYDITTHVVTGRLDAIAFGEELNGLSGGFGQTSTKMSLGSSDISVTGLGLDAKDGDDVNGILYGMMTGNAAKFLTLLETSAVKFTGGDGGDSYVGGNKADVLHGKGGGDTLSGGKGNDRIFGEAGADTLTGGAGKDQFVFNSATHSTLDKTDTITDFDLKAGDLINLDAMDANSRKSQVQDFDFIGKAEFSGTAGELRVEKSQAATYVYGDTNGDGDADFALRLLTPLTLHASDFVL